MRELLGLLKRGGIAALSFWRFMGDEKLEQKALELTRQGSDALGLKLGEQDFLLGWNGEPGAYRYCHNYTDAEVEDLIVSVNDIGTCIDRFASDGRNAALNGYAVFRRC